MRPTIIPSRRVRRTHWTEQNTAAGVKTYTVYNHMLLPAEFESIEADYWHLCEHVQVWDVACERQVQLKGRDAARLAQLMTPRDLSTAKPLQGKYAPTCNAQGGILNDPIAIKVEEDLWWFSIADSDIKLWAAGLAQGYGLDVDVSEPDISPLAVQGPKADELVARVFGSEVCDIRFFWGKMLPFQGSDMYVARSGWSKQGGFEIYVNDAKLAVPLWEALFAAGKDLNVRIGCPNQIERMEGGLLSYGSDMDDQDTPFECGLGSYLDLNADVESLSLPALRAHATQQTRQLQGVLFASSPTSDSTWIELGDGLQGEIRSQVWSPRYQKHLAFVMLPFAYTHRHSTLEHGGVQGQITPLPFSQEALQA